LDGVQALEYHNTDCVLDRGLPSLFHDGRGIIEEGFLDHFDSISWFLNENEIRLFSFDLGPAAEKVAVEDYYYISESEILTKDEIKTLIRQRLNYIRERFIGELAFENLNFFPFPAYAHVCEGDFISEVVHENDAFLVLDVAHAEISARNFGMTLEDYISKLPLERVKEIHLCSPGIVDGNWRDLHRKPCVREFELLDWISEKVLYDPYVVVEYYGDFDGIKSAYQELGCLINRRSWRRNPEGGADLHRREPGVR
jgi:uncharacterized protein (UPF0276 family)